MANDVLSKHGNHVAVIMAGTGEQLTHAELDERSRRLANAFQSAGLERGGHVAILMESHIRYFEVVFAALRSGLYITPISGQLTADEAAYIVHDCGTPTVSFACSAPSPEPSANHGPDVARAPPTAPYPWHMDGTSAVVQ